MNEYHTSQFRPVFQRSWYAARSVFAAFIFAVIFVASAFPADQIANRLHTEAVFGPPKDYLPKEKAFIANGEIPAAVALGDFEEANPDLPNAHEIISLSNQVQADYNSWWERSKPVSWGFLTGDTDSPQGMAGDMAANFLVYGNIRDLTKQGYYKVTGKPVDSLVVALSAAGLLADVATYFPPTTEGGLPAETGFSLLKSLERIGALTTEFTDKVISLAKGARTAERMKELAACATDTVKVYHRVPAGTLGYVMRDVETPEELARISKVTETAPKEVALALTLSGREGMEEINAADASKQTLTSFLRFGPKSIVRILKPTHVFVGILKTSHIEGLSNVLYNMLPEWVRRAVIWMSGSLAVAALLNAGRHVNAIRRLRRRPA